MNLNIACPKCSEKQMPYLLVVEGWRYKQIGKKTVISSIQRCGECGTRFNIQIPVTIFPLKLSSGTFEGD